MGEVWVVDAIALNLSMKLDFADCTMGFGKLGF